MRRLARLLLVLIVVLCLAAPAWALEVAGKVLGPNGQPVAGAFISDGERIVATGADGAFRLSSKPGLVVALTAPSKLRPAGRWWWPAEQAAKLGTLRLAAAPPHGGGQYRLAVLSDPHLYVAALEPGWAKGLVDPRLPMLTWQRIAARLRASKPALTLITGDIAMDAEKGSEEQGRAFMEMTARAANLLPGDWRATPGNHDVRYEGGKVSLKFWRQYMGPARSVTRLGPVAVIMLDNVGLSQHRGGKPQNCGITGPAGLAWLKAVLALLPPDTPLVIASHFPLFSPLAGANPLYPRSVVQAPGPEGLALRDVDQSTVKILEMLKGRNLMAHISGHQHAWFDDTLLTVPKPMHHIGAPAICGRWWQGDMRYGPVSFKPGYLEGWLVERRGQWRVQLSMVQVNIPAK
ncbi:MAG: metallophosphoesterase [Desulfarculaceae bacterium]|nr:metallophosphoesterase [Desulfarculaceae bacterium]